MTEQQPTEQQPIDLEERRSWMRWRMKEAYEAGEPMRWFEELYASAEGLTDVIPWADLRPNPILMQWLDESGHAAPAPNADGSGAGSPSRAVVVGAGLGDDVPPLVERGWAVTGFDVAATAMDWAAQRWTAMAAVDSAHPAHAANAPVEWRHANLLDLPADMRGAYDFALEIYTFQALPLELRDKVAAGLRQLLKPGGELLMIARTPPEAGDTADAAPPAEPPPWPVVPEDVQRHFLDVGLFEVLDAPRVLPDPLEPQFRRLRAHLRAI